MCYVDHSDSGWFARAYNYNCQISHVDFFEAPNNDYITAETTAAKAADDSNGDTTTIFFSDYLRGIGGSTEGAPIDYFFLTLPGVSTDARQATTVQMLTKNTVAYASERAYENRKLIGETGQRQLDAQKQYMVLTDSEPYLTKDIGCAIGKILFCSSPIAE
jgi:hypothetical protein